MMPRRRLGAVLCLAILAGMLVVSARGQPPSRGGAFEVGGAFADITPKEPMPNYYRSVHRPDPDASPLRVHAVVCREAATTVVIVSVDCTFIGRDEVARIREAVSKRIGVAPDHVCIAATHTHASPATTASFLNGQLPDPGYLDLLVERTCAAVEQAASRMQPARMAAATVPAPAINACRRRISQAGQAYMVRTEPDEPCIPENAIDQTISYIVFETPSGTPLAALFNFGCHNNMVNGVFSADFFGRTGEVLRQSLGEIATVSLAAPSGDVSFYGPTGKRLSPDDRSMGRAIAGAILDSYRTAPRYEGGDVAVRSIVRRIADRPYDPKDFAYDLGRGAGANAVAFHQARYAPEEAAVRERGATACEVEFQAIRLGRVAIVTNPAELFSIYGVRIKQASSFAVTMVSSLTNGYCGYVPTREAFTHGGYETYRTVHTSRLVKDAGDQILRESIGLLRALDSDRRPDATR